jgi:hypothetical protein
MDKNHPHTLKVTLLTEKSELHASCFEHNLVHPETNTDDNNKNVQTIFTFK